MKKEQLNNDTRELLIQDIDNGYFDISSYCDNPEELLG